MVENGSRYFNRAMVKMREMRATERSYVDGCLKEVVDGYLVCVESGKAAAKEEARANAANAAVKEETTGGGGGGGGAGADETDRAINAVSVEEAALVTEPPPPPRPPAKGVRIPADLIGGKDRIIFGNIRDIYDFHQR